MYIFNKFRRWVRSVDWRVWAIVAAIFVLVIVTGIFYYLRIGLDPSTHFGAVFAAWVGGVALFVVAGAVVAIISLVRPEQESFDARARILFRRQSGKHIDYIVYRIKEILEHYSEETSIKVTLREYDPASSKYRIAVTHDVVVRSYLDDIQSTYHSSVSYAETTLPPTGRDPNRFMYLRIDGRPVIRSEEFQDAFERPISTTIDRDSSCELSCAVEFWTKANEEENNHKTRRYTQLLRLEFENLIISPEPVKIRLNHRDNPAPCDIYIAHGESKQVLELRDVLPGIDAYNYWIVTP